MASFFTLTENTLPEAINLEINSRQIFSICEEILYDGNLISPRVDFLSGSAFYAIGHTKAHIMALIESALPITAASIELECQLDMTDLPPLTRTIYPENIEILRPTNKKIDGYQYNSVLIKPDKIPLYCVQTVDEIKALLYAENK